MREIKFRAWYIHPESSVKWVEYFTLESDPYRHCENETVEVVEIEQYTGLKDKNGVEIYEGDVLLFTCYGHPYKDKVEYRKWGYYPIANVDERIALSADGDVEVIGNIHENPELLQ